jgi:hypothetical protein
MGHDLDLIKTNCLVPYHEESNLAVIVRTAPLISLTQLMPAPKRFFVPHLQYNIGLRTSFIWQN